MVCPICKASAPDEQKIIFSRGESYSWYTADGREFKLQKFYCDKCCATFVYHPENGMPIPVGNSSSNKSCK